MQSLHGLLSHDISVIHAALPYWPGRPRAGSVLIFARGRHGLISRPVRPHSSSCRFGVTLLLNHTVWNGSNPPLVPILKWTGLNRSPWMLYSVQHEFVVVWSRAVPFFLVNAAGYRGLPQSADQDESAKAAVHLIV